jgi:hypothetical protein
MEKTPPLDLKILAIYNKQIDKRLGYYVASGQTPSPCFERWLRCRDKASSAMATLAVTLIDWERKHKQKQVQ